MMLRTMCRGQKGKILRQYIIKSPFISLFCNEGRRQCCCYFFSLFVENVATSKKQEKNCSRISFSFITIFMARWVLVLSKPRIHENGKDCFWFGKFSKFYELKWNSPFVTQDQYLPSICFAILIFTDISIKIHNFVCIKQA